MPKVRRLFTGSIGINNKITPERLPYDSETGVHAFEAATDVVIDRTGCPVTTRGNTLLESGDYHSLYPAPSGLVAVKNRTSDSALYYGAIDSDGTIPSLTGMRSSMSMGAKCDYAWLGDKLLYCNGFDNGYVRSDFTSQPWPTSEWPGGDNTGEMITTPVGRHLDVLSGRVLLAVGDEVFCTEYGLPGLVDATRSRRRFGSKVTMICAVQTGFYVSDLSAVYFIGGLIPKDWTIKKVLNYPAVEWSVNQDLVDPSFFGLETTQLSCLFGTVNGPVLGMPDGTVFNLIDKNVTMPDCGAKDGSIMVVDETMVIQSAV